MAVVDRLRSLIAGVAASQTEQLLARAAAIDTSVKLDNVEFQKRAAELRDLSNKIYSRLQHTDKTTTRHVLALSNTFISSLFVILVGVITQLLNPNELSSILETPILKWIYPLVMNRLPVIIVSLTFVMMAQLLGFVIWRMRKNRIKITNEVVRKRMELLSQIESIRHIIRD